MPFNLNISINGLWPVVTVTNTIPTDVRKIRDSVKMFALDIIEAQVVAEKNTLLSARDEKAKLLAKVSELEAKIKGMQPAKKGPGPGRPKKAKKVVIDYQDLDNEEIRDYMAGKSHLMADPRF